ncbi:MAG: HAD hydrolase family protein, partial [Euryarchaeota archaeon]|nr:HAD hydrolase family protein [Euryarchaeota archaeon]
MGIKLVTIDIDGTLTDDSKILSTRGIEALRQVQNRGITVCLISGNVLPITYALHTYIGLKGPFISENGGVIYHDGEVIKLFDITLPKEALEVLKRDMGLQEPFTSQWRLTEV